MTNSAHLQLSDFIKSVHQKLREDTVSLGLETAWEKHCEDEHNLEKYAKVMKNLATEHWENSYKTGNTVSRVEWVYDFVQKYFIKGDIFKQRQKEIEIALKINVEIDKTLFWQNDKHKKFDLLDVGSCYNPFKVYSCFKVTAIDLAPACQDVYQCDFLNLQVTSEKLANSTLEVNIRKLQENTFDVIIFSLLLEYLPSPKQRLLCCDKAYKLLKTEGVLIIITPDSKHVGANAKIMKSWRFILAKTLGLSRIKYEKLPHLHCMAFRKCLQPNIAHRWAFLQDSKQFYDEIYIPQDFKKYDKIEDRRHLTDSYQCDLSLFKELPLAAD